MPIAFAHRRHLTNSVGDIPIACTLAPDQIPDRVNDWNHLLQGAVRRSIDGGVRIQLGDDTDIADVARLAAAEQRCCRFFSFRLTIDERGASLEITAPPDALDIVHTAFGTPQ